VLEERDILGWIGVGIDTHESKELQLALSESNARLHAANAVKDEFLSLVSHELRTPLTTISGLAEVFARRLGTMSKSEVDASIAQLQRDANRLHVIVENLLVLTRLESERLEFEPVLLHRVAGDVVRTVRPRFPGRRIAVVVERDVPPVQGIADLIRMVIENLVENSARYSSADAPITIRVRGAPGEVMVAVLDRGRGISPDERDRIFEPFYRSRAVQAHVPGIGLGLTVCRRLIDLHEGKLAMRSRKGGGSAFEFSLPALVES
jgi:two-component system sensor histidine kinase KdpD